MYGLSVVVYEYSQDGRAASDMLVAVLTVKDIKADDDISDLSTKMFRKWCSKVGCGPDEAGDRFYTEVAYTIIWDKEEVG